MGTRKLKTVAIVNQKGGAGKTSLTLVLSVEAERAGAGPVAMLDFDPQGSLTQTYEQRDAEVPIMARATLKDLEQKLDMLDAAGYRLVFIDTPPTASPALDPIVKAADYVLIPMQESAIDLRAVGPTIDLVEKHGKTFLFVMIRVQPNTNLYRQALAALSHNGPVASVPLVQRTAFKAAMSDGRTIGEVAPKSAGAKEVSLLWDEIYRLLKPRKAKEKKFV